MTAITDHRPGPEVEIKHVRPSAPDSVEQLCHDSGKDSFLLDFGRNGALSDVLGESRPERYIGVIYRPETEHLSHYMDSAASRQFDALVWFDNTTPVKPLAAQSQAHAKVPDTFPSGM